MGPEEANTDIDLRATIKNIHIYPALGSKAFFSQHRALRQSKNLELPKLNA